MGKCDCTDCPACNGTGMIFYLLGEYCGAVRPMDDLADTECCDECGGEGIIDFCEKCQWEEMKNEQ